MKHGISVICWIYNEEKRIEQFIRAHYEYDEIIIIDKSSTDNSYNVASKMGVKVVSIPYTEEFKHVYDAAIECAKYDWLFFVTASDIEHPEFTKRLYKCIDDEEFNERYNNIRYPCVHHILGVSGKNTAIDWGYRNWLGRRDSIRGQSVVHNEIYYINPKTYVFDRDDTIAQHHLGYPSVDVAYERSLRYTKEEIKKDVTYKSCFKNICKLFIIGIFKQKVWIRKWDGFTSLFWVLSYQMMVYFRVHERECGDINQQYESIREQFINGQTTFRNQEYEKRKITDL